MDKMFDCFSLIVSKKFDIVIFVSFLFYYAILDYVIYVYIVLG